MDRGLVNSGRAIIKDSVFTNYEAGAILNRGGYLVVTDSIFQQNSCSHGCAIYGEYAKEGDITITNSVFQYNSAQKDGGALYFDGTSTMTLTIANSAFQHTPAQGRGGALDTAGITTITNSTFANNSASGAGGAISSSGSGESTIINSTFFGNSAPEGGGVWGIYSLWLISSTFTSNSASRAGGGVSRASVSRSPVNIVSTIIAHNTATEEGPDVLGEVTSWGNNLIGDTAGSSGWFGYDLQNADPLLDTLGDNGGPTQTIALLEGSPAIDAGFCAGDQELPPVTTDQRGAPRGEQCDIGAFEYGAEAPIGQAVTESSDLPAESGIAVGPRAELLGVDRIDECHRAPVMLLTGFAPNSEITVTNHYTSQNICTDDRWDNCHWVDTRGLFVTDEDGSVTISYTHGDWGTYNFSFEDTAGNWASLTVSYSAE